MFEEPSKRKKTEQIQLKPKSMRLTKQQAQRKITHCFRAQSESLQKKRLIHEMQQEYIKRCNILASNKRIYYQIIQSLATQLDWQGVTTKQLAEVYTKFKSFETYDEKTQAE